MMNHLSKKLITSLRGPVDYQATNADHAIVKVLGDVIGLSPHSVENDQWLFSLN